MNYISQVAEEAGVEPTEDAWRPPTGLKPARVTGPDALPTRSITVFHAERLDDSRRGTATGVQRRPRPTPDGSQCCSSEPLVGEGAAICYMCDTAQHYRTRAIASAIVRG